MTKSIVKSALVLGLMGGLAGLSAAPASAAPAAGKLGACSQDAKAKGLKGDELKAQIKTCRADARTSCIADAKAANTPKADMHAFLVKCMRG